MMEKINFLMFFALSAVILASAFWAVFAKKIVHSVIGAAVCFLTIAGLFFTLNADFVGVSQIFIYGVGVSILLAFAIMFTSKEDEDKLYLANWVRVFLGFVAVGALFCAIFFFISPEVKTQNVFLQKQHSAAQIKNIRERGTSKIIGKRIFCDYVLPFELLSLLLLAGIVGAGYLACQDKEGEKESV